ncbi:hypothetical protein IQ22_01470 [Pseudomonas duriflava]|uniref:DUF3509 domain-containing protein n=1 Tax=Pseudomonas duriflava TaxID=459528 RepID=A0A562QHM3_9PSED|nr:hypothetical protein [Pseudomonas duriflava]TWI55546.1 hypothetical protein IQ22_01470 [Pseudomonas duriflava]
MSTPLSLDAAEKLVVRAFVPLGCVTSANPDGKSFGFSVLNAQGEQVFALAEVTSAQYGNPMALKCLIEEARQEVIQKGETLNAWEMPFITDPDALPPPAVN